MVQSLNFVFSFLFVEIFPLLLLQGLLLHFFFAKVPIVFKFPHVYTLCNYSSPSSIAFTCLYLYFYKTVLFAGHGVLPSVLYDEWLDEQIPLSPFNTYSPNYHHNKSQTHLKPFVLLPFQLNLIGF